MPHPSLHPKDWPKFVHTPSSSQPFSIMFLIESRGIAFPGKEVRRPGKRILIS
jgi:hypothetical protein